MVNSLIEHMEVLAGQMSLRSCCTRRRGPDTVRADRSLVRRILFNLLFNAAKYSPPDPRSPSPSAIRRRRNGFWSLSGTASRSAQTVPQLDL
jgi:signal transduction histidine kinase